MSKLKRKYGVGAELREAEDRVSRDDHGEGGRAGPPQEAVGRARPVRRLLGAHARRRRAATGYEFVDEIVGGSIPSKFIPAVDKGIQEASARGVLAGYPMVDFEVELFDGSYHSVDSNEMSFKMAGIQAFKTVAPKCRPVLLEPLDEIEVTTPDQYLGDVMGDISSRRGSILGTDAVGDGARHARARGRAAGGAAPLRDGSPLDDARPRDVHAPVPRLRADAGRSGAASDRGVGEDEGRRAGRGLNGASRWSMSQAGTSRSSRERRWTRAFATLTTSRAVARQYGERRLPTAQAFPLPVRPSRICVVFESSAVHVLPLKRNSTPSSPAA